MKSISIIIPVFNSAKWLTETLNSCLDQKDYIREIILIDDQSNDDSWNIISYYQLKYPFLVKGIKNNLKGGNNARNLGFEKSSGAYIQWLDADDQVLMGKFAAQLKYFKENPVVDIVYSDWKLLTFNADGDLVTGQEKLKNSHQDFLYELLINNWSPPNNYLLTRKAAESLHAIKAWNPETQVLQDREYFTLAAILGHKFGYAPGVFSVYNRWSSSSVSNIAKTEIKNCSLNLLLNRFEALLYKQTHIDGKSLLKYQNIINTNKVLLTISGFSTTINRGKLTLSSVNWDMVKGVRTSLRVFKAILFKNRQRSGTSANGEGGSGSY